MLFMAKMKLTAMVTAAVMLIGGLGVGTYVAAVTHTADTKPPASPVAAVPPATATRPVDVKSDGTLAVGIMPAKGEYTYGEPITVRFDVTNVSKQPIALWSRACSWGNEVYFFEITQPDGKTITVGEPLVPWLRNVPATQMLEPEKTFSLQLDLMRMGAWPLPAGEFAICGVYKAADFSNQKALWTGRIATGPVKVTLKPSWKADELRTAQVAWVAPEHLGSGDVLMVACPPGKLFKQGDIVDVKQRFRFRPGVRGVPIDMAIAVGKVEEIFGAASMACVKTEAGKRFDEIRLEDEVTEHREARFAGHVLRLAPTQPDQKAQRTILLDYGPMRFLVTFERNEGEHRCTLRTERISSRGEAATKWTLWSSRFSSWPDTVKFEDGLLVAPNEFRTLWIEPLSGKTIKQTESPPSRR